MDRREFVKKGVLTSAGILLLPGLTVSGAPSKVGRFELTGPIQKERIIGRSYGFQKIEGDIDPEQVLDFVALYPSRSPRHAYMFKRARMKPELHNLENPGDFAEEIELVFDDDYKHTCLTFDDSKRIRTKLYSQVQSGYETIDILETEYYFLPVPGYNYGGMLGKREKDPEQTDFYLMNTNDTETEQCKAIGSDYQYRNTLFKGKVFHGHMHEI